MALKVRTRKGQIAFADCGSHAVHLAANELLKLRLLMHPIRGRTGRQDMTAPASPGGAHGLPRQSGKPGRGRPGILESALVL